MQRVKDSAAAPESTNSSGAGGSSNIGPYNPLHNPTYSTFYNQSNEYNYSIHFDGGKQAGPTKSTAMLNAVNISSKNQNIILEDDDEEQKSGILGTESPPPVPKALAVQDYSQQPLTRASIKMENKSLKITTKKHPRKHPNAYPGGGTV